MSDDVDITLDVWVNPLAFHEVDEPWASTSGSTKNAEAFLHFLCTPGIGSDLNDLTERYKQISQEPTRLFLAPAEEHILDKLVWPLRHAKGCFMVGNHLGTISLCGMVAEMVAILTFEISPHQMSDHSIDKAILKKLLGSSFENLGQDRRVSILHALDLINDEQKKCYSLIRTIRKRYLHFYSEEYDNLASDAISVFQAAANLVVGIIGQEIRQGKWILNPNMAAYLAKEGFAKITPPQDDSAS